MRGYIAAAAASSAGRSTHPKAPPPKVILITTVDTKIGADVIAEATRQPASGRLEAVAAPRQSPITHSVNTCPWR
jgi:hypothetical protein